MHSVSVADITAPFTFGVQRKGVEPKPLSGSLFLYPPTASTKGADWPKAGKHLKQRLKALKCVHIRGILLYMYNFYVHISELYGIYKK